MTRRLRFPALAFVTLSLLAAASAAPLARRPAQTALDRYVKTPDPAYPTSWSTREGSHAHRLADRDDLADVADREGSGPAGLDALAHGDSAGDGQAPHRARLRHRRRQRRQAAGASTRCSSTSRWPRSRSSPSCAWCRTSRWSSPARRATRKEDELHRLHLGQVPAHRRRAMAGAPADDEGGGAGDGHGHHASARSRSGRLQVERFVVVRRLEARLDDLDHRRGRSARRRDRAAWSSTC